MSAPANADREVAPVSRRVVAWRHRRDGEPAQRVTDEVAEEVAVALEYNGIAHAVMMATPADLEDFAAGFTLTEGIVDDVREIYDIQVDVLPNGVQVSMDIASARFASLKSRRRSLTGRTGCGICGAENLDHALRDPGVLAPNAFGMPADRLHAAFDALRDAQPLQQLTGATHAAGWVDAVGQLSMVREDVGRHNALDKLLGALARQGADRSQGAVIVTSRASVEMVQKTASLGVPILATISGPTALAIRMAEQSGLTLAAFFRERGHVRYAHGQRLT